MTIKTVLGAAVLVGATATITTQVVSQDAGDPAAAAAAEMQKWMELGQPGAEHKEMAKLVGTWTQSTKHWMYPGSEASEGTSSVTVKSIYDGRYLIEEMKGSFDMEGQEMPMEGMGIFGFDRAKKKHYFVWLDNMSTGIMYGEGTKDANGSIVYYSEMPDPTSGGMMKLKSVATEVKGGMHEFMMYQKMPDDSWFQMMAAKMTKTGTR